MRIHGSKFGIVGNGVHDDSAGLLIALKSNQQVSLSGLHLRIENPIIVNGIDTDFIDIDGGDSSLSSITFVGIDAANLAINGVRTKLSNITINCSGHQTANNAGLHLRHCNGSQLSNLIINDYDNIGVLLFECDNVTVSQCRFDNPQSRFDADNVGTSIQLAGCSDCSVVSCQSFRSNFNYSVIGKEYTDNAQSGAGEAITRPVSETIGNVIQSCSAVDFRGTAFNVNGANGTVFRGCTARNQILTTGHPAFQIKHPLNGLNASHNRFTGCMAQDVYTGFYAQGGSLNSFSNCSTLRTQRFGFRVNLADNCTITNCIAEQFAILNETNTNGGFVVRQSDYCILDNCTSTPSPTCPATAALISIELDSSHTQIGNFSAGGNCPTGLIIGSTAISTKVSDGCKSAMETAVTPYNNLSSTTEGIE